MDFDARVAVLTALADPARLRIVDVLGAGDASPGELRSHLGLSSNLLAHHLKVLEQAAVVSRHRSHADKRRTYLRLHRERLAGLLPAAAQDIAATSVARVVFVCTANSARSQLAAALWRQASPIPVASGGTRPGHAIAPGAVSAARRHGLRLVQERPQSLDGLLRDGDYVVTVCDAAHEETSDGEAVAPVRLAGVSHWSVPDPVAVGTDVAFDAAYDDIAGRVADLAPRLSPRSGKDA